MRITNNMLQQTALNHVQGNLRLVADAQRNVSSGLRLHKPSDDPVATSSALRTRGSLRALEQYRTSIDSAGGRASMEEGVLDQLTGVLTRAKELATSAQGPGADASTRGFTKMEVDQLLRTVVDLGNTRYEDAYLFGGTQTDRRPYAVVEEAGGKLGFTSTDPRGEHRVEVSEQRFVRSNRNGYEVFEQSGVLDALKQLSDALGESDGGSIASAHSALDGAFSGVQTLLGDVGARLNQLEVTRANLDAMEINLLTFKSNLEEVDMEAAVTELIGRQTTFQAAMLATSRVMGLTLADYLR